MSTPQPAANKPTIEEENDSNTFSDEDCCEFEYNSETTVPPKTKQDDLFKLYQKPTMLSYNNIKSKVKDNIIGENPTMKPKKKTIEIEIRLPILIYSDPRASG